MAGPSNDVARLQNYQPPETVRAAPTTPMEAMYAAVERGAPMEIIERMAALAERWEANQARKAFDAAMAAARAEMPLIAKNRTVDFTSSKGRTHYKHEDLGEIVATVSPILGKHGLSFRFRTTTEGKTAFVTCVISHRDGHTEENTLSAAHDDSGNKNSIQALASAITYLQRVTLKAALGLAASNDDDGRATSSPADDKGGGAISDDQVKQLRDALVFRGVPEARALKSFNVSALEGLPAADFADCLAIINRAGKR